MAAFIFRSIVCIIFIIGGMAALIEDEVNSCLSEMERLQEKIKLINKTRKEQQIIDEAKLNKVEPNLAVLEKWLTNQPGLDYDKAAEKAKEDYDNILIETNNYEEWYQKDMERSTNNLLNGRPTRITNDSPRDPLHNPERKKITDTYNLYHGPDNISRSHGEKPKLHRPHPGGLGTDFVEATYNLFKIQQKRIEELEAKLEQKN